MAFIDQRFPDRDEIVLAVCTDWHLGSETCNERAVKEYLKMIQEENWLVLLLGDLTENATIGSVGAVFEQVMNPQEQVKYAIDLLKPIQGNILGSVPGNHGARTKRVTGLDPDQVIAWELGIPLFNYIVTGRLQVGDSHWMICGHHGVGGGNTPGAKLNALHKLSAVHPACDLYLMGHTHADCADSDRVVMPSINRGAYCEVWHTRHYSGCGALLDYQGSYAEAKVMRPAAMVQVVHMLGTRTHKKRDGMDRYHKPYLRVPKYL